MKKRNLVIVAFMLVAAMTIGVGYAALSVTLTVTGSASVSGEAAQDEFTEDVYFSLAEKVPQTGGTHVKDDAGDPIEDAITLSPDKRSATFQVKTLMGVDEYVEYTFTVKNESTMAATVTPTITMQDTNGAYEVKVTNITNVDPLTTGTTNCDSFELAAGDGTQSFNVRITLKKIPTDEQEIYNLTFGINLLAEIDNP